MSDVVLRPGDHVRLARFYGLYDHHAIYEGNGWFISLRTDEQGGNAMVRRDYWDSMHRGDEVTIVQYARQFPPEHTLAMARSQLGRREYDVWNWNCEHWARWLKTGTPRSDQSEMARGVTTAAGLTAAAALSGTAALASAPVALGSFALAPTVAIGMGLQRAYSDDPNLTTQERTARDAARTGALVGGGAGTLAAIGAVAMASRSGSALTGVRALGAALGGGAKVGVAVVCLLPAVAAATLAWAYYQAENSQGTWAPPTRTTLL